MKKLTLFQRTPRIWTEKEVWKKKKEITKEMFRLYLEKNILLQKILKLICLELCKDSAS